MTRTLESFNDIGHLADNGERLRTEVVCATSVTITRRNGGYQASLIVSVVATGQTLTITEREFSSREELLDTLGIDDIDEQWEMLDN